MVFTEAELAYLRTQPLGRLATIGPRGAPHVRPVSYRVNQADGTVDIGGPKLSRSQKYRNLMADRRASFVVDDVASPEQSLGRPGQLGRGVEIRGHAELLHAGRPLFDGFTNELIRIHPRRILAWNLDGPGLNARNLANDDHMRSSARQTMSAA